MFYLKYAETGRLDCVSGANKAVIALLSLLLLRMIYLDEWMSSIYELFSREWLIHCKFILKTVYKMPSFNLKIKKWIRPDILY